MQPSPLARTAASRIALRSCLVASGAAALIYEVLWLREFGLVMGNTAYALSTVLSSFLGGLAVGAWIAGRWSKHHTVSPRLYAAVELAIGASAVAMPWLIRACDPLFGMAYRSLGDAFVAYNFVQFFVCGALLFVPTFLMGTSLPLVATLLAERPEDVGRETGLLYALNSFGGVLGAAVAGFVLLPTIGMLATGLVAASLNVAAALLAALAGGPAARPHAFDSPESRDPVASQAQWQSPAPGLLVVLYGLSGFAALALEVGWARIVSLAIGSTTYGFTITLVTYIAGLAAGSFAAPRVAWLARDPLRGVFALHAVIALWTLASLPWLGELPIRVVEWMGADTVEMNRLLAGQLVLVQLTIAVPTLAMGAMFPLVAQLLHRAVASTGQAAGTAYASNTFGNIAGSWVAGFVLLPWIGMQGAIRLSAMLYAVAGVLFVFTEGASRPRRVAPLAAALLATVGLVAWMTPAWRRELVSTAPYLAAKELGGQRRADITKGLAEKGGELVDYRESSTGVVTVRRKDEAFALFQDGMQESHDRNYSLRMLGHVPMLLHGSAKSALVIGLGGGQTLRGVLAHPVASVESVEMSSDVVAVARQYFAGEALADPRSSVRIGDGRNHLRHSGRHYDVIVSQPSYPWVAGASNLFTREFFREIRDHLEPGGVAATWFQTKSKEASDSIIRAWAETFPRSYLAGERLLIGSMSGEEIDTSKLDAMLADPRVAADVEIFGIKQSADLLALIKARGPELLEQTRGVPTSTDDNGFVAFRALYGLAE